MSAVINVPSEIDGVKVSYPAQITKNRHGEYLVALIVQTEAEAQKILPMVKYSLSLRNCLARLSDQYVDEDSPCHKGVSTVEKCPRCGPILHARKLLQELENYARLGPF